MQSELNIIFSIFFHLGLDSVLILMIFQHYLIL